MEHVTTIQQNNEKVIGSGERLTIETITDYVQLIRAGLGEADTVILEFDPGVEMDITGLQVLCSACKTAAASGKRCIHRGPTPRALIELAAAAGAERHKPCAIPNDSCFRRFGGATTWEN
jgi:anti-anti-sigma regulatory factor